MIKSELVERVAAATDFDKRTAEIATSSGVKPTAKSANKAAKKR